MVDVLFGSGSWTPTVNGWAVRERENRKATTPTIFTMISSYSPLPQPSRRNRFCRGRVHEMDWNLPDWLPDHARRDHRRIVEERRSRTDRHNLDDHRRGDRDRHRDHDRRGQQRQERVDQYRAMTCRSTWGGSSDPPGRGWENQPWAG